MYMKKMQFVSELKHHPFSIPRLYESSPTTPRKHTSTDLRQLDLAVYRERTRSEDAIGNGICAKILGEVAFELFYIQHEEVLAASLKSIDKIGTPSPSVIGSRWTCKPQCTVSILPEKRSFFDSKGFKHKWDLKEHSTNFIGVKKSEFADKTLRLTIYDSNRNHNHLPIGHVLVPLRDLQMTGRTYPFLKQINVYSEPAGFNRGKMDLSVTWIGSAEKLEVKIGRTRRLRSPRGILGRGFYVKMSVFIGSEEERSFKTAVNKADPDLDFKEKLVIPLQSSQLRDLSLLFYVYAKQLAKLSITSELIGTTVIGPYMCSRAHDNMTQWEQMILKPLEEITEVHTLFV